MNFMMNLNLIFMNKFNLKLYLLVFL